jgi:predicted NUDIX family NTP pyrophosphohydrolase
MARKSAGLVVYRFRDSLLEIFLVHPGGPFWSRKDEGAWSIPKGEYGGSEDPLEVAKREFEEETGFKASGEFLPLAPIRQPGGKIVSAWAVEGEYDAGTIKSNTFILEWPPRSGKKAEFPEIDRAQWFSPAEAGKKILKGQAGFITQLFEKLGYRGTLPLF